MLGDIEMHQPAPAVRQHHEHEKDSKRRRRHREEIQRDEILGVIPQKRAPRLRRWPPMAERVLRHRRLRDRQAQLQQSAVDSWCTPERIGGAHSPNQVSEVRTDRGPTDRRRLSRPSSVETPDDASQSPSPAGPPATNAANSSTASTAQPKRSDQSPSAAAAAGAPCTRRVAVEAPGSPARVLGACERLTAASQGQSRAISS